MTIDLAFKQVCEYIKRDNSSLIDSVDKLLGFALICSPLVAPPAIVAVLPTLAVKNEMIKIAKGVFDKISSKLDSDYVARERRMQNSYALICYTAFFEALDRELPEAVRKKIALLKSEKVALARSADMTQPPVADRKPEAAPGEFSGNSFGQLSFAHPTESLGDQRARLRILYTRMAKGFIEFVQKLAVWEDEKEGIQHAVTQLIAKLPDAACQMF